MCTKNIYIKKTHCKKAVPARIGKNEAQKSDDWINLQILCFGTKLINITRIVQVRYYKKNFSKSKTVVCNTNL